MCGIAGIIGARDFEPIRAMMQVQAHRGPDDEGTFIDAPGGAALGHRRLSIIDLSAAGHQPMGEETGRFWITYNGELYNFREIREELESRGVRFRSQSDTEVILEAYKCWGAESLARMNGMFAFAIWDTVERRLFAARDRIGVKPFYYYHKEGLFVFASEVKALFESGCVPRALDLEPFVTMKHYQPSPVTGFRDVRKLPPGCTLNFSGGRLEVARYWSLTPAEERMDESAAAARLDLLLHDAVRLQMVSDVPVGTLLSGGLDSSLILALMNDLGFDPATTFTIRYRPEDRRRERMPDDSYYARRVADLFHCSHHEITIEPDIVDLLPRMIWHLDEPIADPASINTYLISKAARDRGIVVLLNGMGGDEIFGGYRKHLACMIADRYQAFTPGFIRPALERLADILPVATARRGYRITRWVKRFLSFASYDRYERFILSDAAVSARDFPRLYGEGRDVWKGDFARALRPYFPENGTSYLTRMCHADVMTYLPDHNLTYCDKSAMAASVESRPPLTDHVVVEFMFARTADLRIRGRRQKYLLKKVAEKYLPEEIVRRPKAPFGSPLRSWIRRDLTVMVNDYLSAERLKRQGIFRPEFVREKILLDRSGKEDNSFLIWWLLCNQVWLDTFFPAQ